MNGVFLALASAILIGWSIVIGTVATQDMSPILFVAILYVFSTVAIGGYAVIRRMPFRIHDAFIERRAFLTLLLTRGLFGVVFFMWGISLTTGVRAAFLPLVEPVLVYLFSVMQKNERLSAIGVGSLLPLILGSYLFISNGEFIFDSVVLGDVLLVIGIAFYAFSYVPAQIVSKRAGPLTSMFLVDVISMVVFAVLSIPFLGELPLLTFTHWRLILAFLITGPTLGVALWYAAVRTIRPWVVASLLTLQILSAALLAYVWLGQTLGILQLVGGLLMFAAAIVIVRHTSAGARSANKPFKSPSQDRAWTTKA